MSSPEARTALIERITKETAVQVSLSLEGGALEHLPSRPAFEQALAHVAAIPSQSEEHHASQSSARQQIWVWTGIGFLDHMLHALAKHAGWSLRVRTRGDLAST
jgi:imidazoleglycerol-phosphate dehydratase